MKRIRAMFRSMMSGIGARRRRTNVSHSNTDKTGDALNPNFPSGAQPDADVGSTDIRGASNAIYNGPDDAGRVDVSHNDVDKAGDALNPDSPSGAQLDIDVGSKGIAINGDPGDADRGGMDVSHNDIGKAGEASNADSPSGAQFNIDVGDKDIPRPSNAIEHDSDGSSKPNNPESLDLDAWLKANAHIWILIQDAIESLAEPEVGVPLRTYLSYGDVSKILLKGLELLADAHPVAQVVCTSFKAVVALGTMYQENNQKVAIVRLRMQDLLIAIFQLSDLKHPQEIASGDKKVDIMEKVMKKIAYDIEEAASACDHYMSKTLIRRVIKSLQYETFFADQIAKLVEDHRKLMAQLNIQTARNTALLHTDITQIKEFSKAQLKLLDTSREQDLQMFLELHDGIEACIKNGNVLQELLQKSGEGIEGVLGRQSGWNESWSEAVKKVQKKLREEMAEDVEDAFEKNLERFRKTLDLQGQQLTDIQRGNDKILARLENGAHDYVIDTNFKELWQDMNFKKIVKAKYLVSVLYEHLIEKLRDNKRTSNDQWMLAYLNNAHLQPLREVVDEDATGFITTREINVFVESKLEKWTIFQWIVYWAAGWQYSVAQYKRSIYMLISAMHSIYPRVLPANREAFIEYLQDDTIFAIDKLLRSTHGPPSNAFESGELRRLTEEFTEAEEKRLTDKLKQVKYDIYARYIVSLVTGQGRIERYIYPMLYLLLRRHLGVLSLSTTTTLHPEEIPDMTASLRNLFRAVNERLENLESSFKRSNVDVEEKLDNFAFGMFKLYHENPEKDLSSNGIAKYIYKRSRFDEDIEPPDVALHDLLHKPLNRASLRFPLSPPQAVDDFQNPIQGQWAGQMYCYGRSRFGLMQLRIESSPKGILTGVAVTCQYIMKISGKIRRNKVRIHFDFEHGDGDYDWAELTGRLDAERGIIKGRWGGWHEDEDSEEEEEENSRQQTPKDVEENKDEVHRNGIVAASKEDVDEEAGSSAQQDKLNIIDNSTANLESPSNLVDAGFQVSGKGDTFVFRRTPAPLWRFLPSRPPDSPVALESLARARWSFAFKCVLDQVRRENSPGEYFVERFVEAGRFIILVHRELYENKDYCPRLSYLSTEEKEELKWLKSATCPEFIRPYYALMIDAINRQMHIGYGCDSCDGTIVGNRWACLTCMNDSFTDTVDLCASCVKESVELRGFFVHDASHVLLKCDTRVLDAHWQWMIPRARSMVVQIKKKLRSRSEGRAEPTESSNVIGNGPQSKKDTSTKTGSLTCQTCSEEVSLPCWVRITSYRADSENYLCDKCESKSKPPANDSPEFGLPLLRLGIDDDDAPAVEVVTEESRLAALEKKFEKFDQKLSVMMKLLEKVTGNSLSDV